MAKPGASYGSGGGSRPRPLYGVWIDEALKRNDPVELKQIAQEARKMYPPIIQPLYGVWINHAIESGASQEELRGLLEHAKAAAKSDLSAAISKLEAHLGGTSGGTSSSGGKAGGKEGGGAPMGKK